LQLIFCLDHSANLTTHAFISWLTYFFLILMVMFCPNRGSSKQFRGFSFFLSNPMQVQRLRRGAVYTPLMAFCALS
jgi:hypothetical protein